MNTVTLTENQKTWLKHLDAIDKFDGTLKQYAGAHNLVLQDIYSWKSQLRQKGVIAPAPSHRKKVSLLLQKCSIHNHMADRTLNFV